MQFRAFKVFAAVQINGSWKFYSFLFFRFFGFKSSLNLLYKIYIINLFFSSDFPSESTDFHSIFVKTEIEYILYYHSPDRPV